MNRFKVGDRVRLINDHVHRGEERTISSGPDPDGIYSLGDTWAGPLHMEPVTDRSTPRVGDRVRVVLEGEVSFTSGQFFNIADGPGCINSLSCSSLEILEPEWQVEDVVLAADGEVYFRRKSTWRTSRGTFVAHNAPVRPLVLLARDGKKAA